MRENTISRLSGAAAMGVGFSCLLAATLAWASSFTNYGPIYSNYKMAGNAGGGCISGSIGTTIPGKNFDVLVTFVSEANAESDLKRGYIGFSTLDKRHDVVEGQLRASVFRMCLKPGNYQLVGVNGRSLYSTERVHVPFRVEANKHYYLGSFVFHEAGAQVQCGPRPPLFVEVRDEHARDLPIIMKPDKTVGIEPEIQVIDPTAGSPYFGTCGEPARFGTAPVATERDSATVRQSGN